jgi:hypothetical protein
MSLVPKDRLRSDSSLRKTPPSGVTSQQLRAFPQPPLAAMLKPLLVHRVRHPLHNSKKKAIYGACQKILDSTPNRTASVSRGLMTQSRYLATLGSSRTSTLRHFNMMHARRSSNSAV